MSADYSSWSKEELFTEAMSLMERANYLLTNIELNCEARIARLKAADRSTLSDKDRELLDAQLAFEKERGICYPIQASQATNKP